MATERDYYSILQVNRGANQEAIERAYERLAKIYDPAVSKKPKAPQRWQELNEAYEVLSDKQRRSDYDRHGRRARVSGDSRSEPSAVGWLGFISSPYFFAGATVVGVLAALVALVLISVLGGNDEAAVSQPSVVPTAAPTPQSTPPPVTGDEIATGSGLKYVVTQPGTGAVPTQGQTVVANYTGWLQSDGSQFDSSIGREPIEFALGTGGVIKGWDEAFATMQVGEKRRLIIPPELAYADTGFGNSIPAGATLLFDVELVAIK